MAKIKIKVDYKPYEEHPKTRSRCRACGFDFVYVKYTENELTKSVCPECKWSGRSPIPWDDVLDLEDKMHPNYSPLLYEQILEMNAILKHMKMEIKNAWHNQR